MLAPGSLAWVTASNFTLTGENKNPPFVADFFIPFFDAATALSQLTSHPRITYCCKLIGISSFATLLQHQLIRE
jgi:hypothetical protein